jgi:hypothetical protein
MLTFLHGERAVGKRGDNVSLVVILSLSKLTEAARYAAANLAHIPLRG